ncbi:MAG: hypothetical protein C0478_14000 [Planctomyces sp.]|nr:hypothetical protein [Planctomyces sp.]
MRWLNFLTTSPLDRVDVGTNTARANSVLFDSVFMDIDEVWKLRTRLRQAESARETGLFHKQSLKPAELREWADFSKVDADLRR